MMLIFGVAAAPLAARANTASSTQSQDTQQTTEVQDTDNADEDSDTNESETSSQEDGSKKQENEEENTNSQPQSSEQTTDSDAEDSTEEKASSTSSTQTTTSDKSEDNSTATSSQSQTSDQNVSSDDADEEGASSDTASTTSASSTIETGDATSQSEVDNTVNTNTTNTDATSTADTASTTNATSSAPDTNASSTQATSTHATSSPEATNAGGTTASSTISVSATNTAAVSNSGTTTADTGTNAASGDSASVDTGDAVATTDVVNKMNTNIVNSTGLIKILQSYFGGGGDIDMRDYSFFTPPEEAGSAGQSDLDVDSENRANATNTVSVSANTGNNQAAGDEQAAVNTGDAYAAANVVNLANSNVVDSRYLMLSFNSFGDWGGDLVFPNKRLFKRLYNLSEATSGSTNVSNANNATVTNNMDVSADSGNNSATGSSTQVNTGDASASANVLNMMNQNITGDNAFRVIFRVHGNFTGGFYNAPDGVGMVRQSPGMFALSFSPDKLNDSIGSSGAQNGSDTDISNTNTADILNKINVSANSGNNSASGESSEVNTGNAYASANVINAANTNVLGKNWMTAIVNVFGDWDGSVSFGRPDLWVGARAEYVGDAAPAGSVITYHITVANKGDATARDVTLKSASHNKYIRFNGNKYNTTKSVGTLAPGEVKEITHTVEVYPGMPPATTMFADSAFSVSARENEENPQDNKEQLRHKIIRRSNHMGSNVQYPQDDIQGESRAATSSQDTSTSTGEVAGAKRTRPPAVLVERSRDGTSEVQKGSTVDYSVAFDNQFGGPLYKAIGFDVLRNSDGEVVKKEVWRIGTLNAGERIEADYSVNFSTSTPSDTYTNTAYIIGLGGYASSTKGYKYTSMRASSSVAITETNNARNIAENTSTQQQPVTRSVYPFPPIFRMPLPTEPPAYSIPHNPTLTETQPPVDHLLFQRVRSIRDRILPSELFSHVEAGLLDNVVADSSF